MKRNKFKFYLPWLLAAVMGMPLASCGGDDDEKEEVPPTPAERDKHIDTWTFAYWKTEGRSLVGYEDAKPQTWVIWGKEGTSFNIYLLQSGTIYSAGWVNSNDTILTDEERESKDLTFDVNLPSNINSTLPYNVIALPYYDIDAVLKNNKIECNADLVRKWTFRVWNHGNDTYPGEHPWGAKSQMLTTYERVYIRNNTSEEINVKMKGFDAEEKWYYTKATVSITSELKAEPVGTSTSGDVASEEIKVEPGKNDSFDSWYVPTGKKMKDARLVLDINGREVKTDPISSDVEIENGKYYRMVVKWDGKKLQWVMNREQLGRDGDVVSELPDIPGTDI